AHSLTIRQISREFHRVTVGLYTAGPFQMNPGVFHPETTFGRYCYVADTLRVFTRNHPMNTKSTHGMFYDPTVGVVDTDIVPNIKLVIGNGVWLGHNVI